MPVIDDPAHISIFFDVLAFVLSVPHDKEHLISLIKILGN